jgi:hypothetical protein
VLPQVRHAVSVYPQVVANVSRRHGQGLIRADQHAGQRTIRAKERIVRRRKASDDSTGGLYQPTVVTPVSPFRYVWLLPTPLFLLLPSRRFLHGAVIHGTPLVRYPTAE